MKKTILLVDDEEGIRKVLGISLSDKGYKVVAAENGNEALQIFRKIRPAVVITDIKMPEMDGIELLRLIKQEDPDTEVIMITGHGDLDLAIKSVTYEATDFVTKPINDEILEIALKRASERIAMRQQISQYTQNLEHLVDEKSRKLVAAERMAAIGQTVAGLSHAIKNIAGGLKGGAFVLEKGIDLNKKKYLMQGWEMIKGNVSKITNLSMDLLNYAKTTEIKYQTCHPNQPAREVFELLKLQAHEAGIDLKCEFGPDLGEINFDPELIHRCLLNLVSNALDACNVDYPGNEKKTVRIITAAADGWGVEYQVIDSCCGMDPETKEKIFRGFFSTKGAQGTGIGLMITKKIVDEHNGIIEFESRKGSGSRFILRLPENPKSDTHDA